MNYKRIIEQSKMTQDNRKQGTLHWMMTAAVLLCLTLSASAAEVVYRIVEYNKSTGEFALAASGMIPKDSWVYFQNDYGATTGNRYNQIPRNRQAMLYLEGWRGCTLRSVTLSMCSNNKTGQAGLTLTDGDRQLYTQHPADFASDEWFGEWVSKDLNVYVDITKQLQVPALQADEACLTLKGGTSEGSVYLDAITIEYDEALGMEMESPLGWVYEKLTKKSTLTEGDEVMIYRNGCAAADLDGMSTAHYLDALPLVSTTDVTSREVLCFTLSKAGAAGQWTLIDQHGRLLGATGKQALAWDDGCTEWEVTLGYDGATIASAHSAYGTLRFNAPEGAYARFNLYTSNSLPLPFLYRKDHQREPELARSLTLQESDMTVSLDTTHLSLHATILPASVTDRRVAWSSSNENVATVNGGYVTLHAPGQTIITARTRDGEAQTSLHLTVTAPSGISTTEGNSSKHSPRKTLQGHSITISAQGKKYGVEGTTR